MFRVGKSGRQFFTAVPECQVRCRSSVPVGNRRTVPLAVDKKSKHAVHHNTESLIQQAVVLPGGQHAHSFARKNPLTLCGNTVSQQHRVQLHHVMRQTMKAGARAHEPAKLMGQVLRIRRHGLSARVVHYGKSGAQPFSQVRADNGVGVAHPKRVKHETLHERSERTPAHSLDHFAKHVPPGGRQVGGPIARNPARDGN